MTRECQCGRTHRVEAAMPRHPKPVKVTCECGWEFTVLVERERELGPEVLEGQQDLFDLGQPAEQGVLFR